MLRICEVSSSSNSYLSFPLPHPSRSPPYELMQNQLAGRAPLHIARALIIFNVCGTQTHFACPMQPFVASWHRRRVCIELCIFRILFESVSQLDFPPLEAVASAAAAATCLAPQVAIYLHSATLIAASLRIENIN